MGVGVGVGVGRGRRARREQSVGKEQHSAQRAAHSTQRTAHSAQCTVHSTHTHSTLTDSTQHTATQQQPRRSQRRTAHSTNPAAHSTHSHNTHTHTQHTATQQHSNTATATKVAAPDTQRPLSRTFPKPICSIVSFSISIGGLCLDRDVETSGARSPPSSSSSMEGSEAFFTMVEEGAPNVYSFSSLSTAARSRSPAQARLQAVSMGWRLL